MKERPILFSTPMVQAILEGRKTMTRRVVKPQSAILSDEMARSLGIQPPIKQNQPVISCPYGQPGDVLWVRETYHHTSCLNLSPDDETYGYVYKADNQPWDDLENWNWKPSIYMPKEAARIWLQITNVRVERLQYISEEDAIAEGILKEKYDGIDIYYFYPCNDLRDDSYIDNPITSFYSLWKSINGQDSWNANPWVWVVEFKRINK